MRLLAVTKLTIAVTVGHPSRSRSCSCGCCPGIKTGFKLLTAELQLGDGADLMEQKDIALYPLARGASQDHN